MAHFAEDPTLQLLSGGGISFKWRGETYDKGLLLLRCPSMHSLRLFMPKLTDVEDFASTEPAEDIDALDHNPEPFLQRGDVVRVLRGEMVNCRATVWDISRPSTVRTGTVTLGDFVSATGVPLEAQRELTVSEGDIRREISPGSHVKVMVGPRAGVTGMVIIANDQSLTIVPFSILTTVSSSFYNIYLYYLITLTDHDEDSLGRDVHA